MPPLLVDWLNLLLRWTHVIAAIMWIGDSFLFVWMDRALHAPTRARPGDVAGEMWMVHSGGFYEVVKRRTLAPDELPDTLHWFQWEAYTTWLSGASLLVLVYWAGARAFLLGAAGLGVGASIAISVGSLLLAVVVYEAMCHSPLVRRPAAFALVGYALIVAAAWAVTRVFSGRAAFLHVGAMLGTIMVANVAHVIIPGQRRMLADTRAGRPVDPAPGLRAKTRSMHNHYLTLPVLFTMLSNHYPAAWGHPLNWLVLALLVLVGGAAKVVMNEGRRTDWRVFAVGIAALVAVIGMTAHPGGVTAQSANPVRSQVPFVQARAIIARRCTTCHAAHPTNPSFPAPPLGVTLEDPARIHALAARIRERAVITKTMPLGNLTGMTEAERDTLGAWLAQGATIAR